MHLLKKNQMSELFGTPFFQQIDECIEGHGHEAQEYDGHQEPIHLEEVKRQKDSMTIVFVYGRWRAEVILNNILVFSHTFPGI